MKPYLCLLAVAGPLSAQFFPDLEIAEILVQPATGSSQTIELLVGNAPVSTAGWLLVVGQTNVSFPALSLQPNASLLIRLGAQGANTAGEIWLPSAPPLGTSDSVTLFDSSQVNDPGAVVGYVSWGGAIGIHAAVAVQAGRWSAVSDSAVLPSQVGATLANRRFTRNAGNLVGPNAWYHDTTPTLGSENDPAMTWADGVGCVTANAPGFGVNSPFDPGPWLGETTTLSVSPTPGLALLVLSTQRTAPIPLDGIGMPLCFGGVTIEATALLSATTGVATFTYTVPAQPQLVGFEFYMQAYVPDPLAGNAAQAQVTPRAKALVGSR